MLSIIYWQRSLLGNLWRCTRRSIVQSNGRVGGGTVPHLLFVNCWCGDLLG